VRARTCTFIAAALLWLPSLATAQYRPAKKSFLQGPFEVGLRGGRDFENHAWSLGALARIPAGAKLELRPSADLFFPKHAKTGWQANADADIKFGPGGTVYGGGGLAFVHFGGDKTRTGYNVFFGVIAAQPEAPIKPFLEFRWTFVHDTSPFRLVGGFTKRLGR
jgi:opacity protein-like surface antigen